jgi:antirestriction protein ArdC
MSRTGQREKRRIIPGSRHNTDSTGHEKRLAREGITEVAPFGSPVYSREELVAELSAAYICGEAGVSNAVICNQAAYIAGWLKKLREIASF